MKIQIVLSVLWLAFSSAKYTKHSLPGRAAIFLPRMRSGRNSKVMLNEESPVEIVNKESKGVEGKDVSALLADLKEALAEVTNYDEEVYNDLDDNNPSDVRQKDRLPKENKSKYNIEQHSFSLNEDLNGKQSPVINIQQPQQQFYNQQTELGQQQYSNLQQQQYFQQRQQQQFSQQPYGQQQPVPRQIQRAEAGALFNQFGDAMGPDANTDPEKNKYSKQPQLNPRQQEQAAEEKNDVRCVKKLMQVEETVYDEKVKCQHTFSEKCHDTFITDYVPTQEKKCETSFSKNCHITYKPMMFEEDVEICNEPLTKTCNNNTIGQGEIVCNTHYETICETRYKEHEVTQDEPECEMVIEKKCKEVTIPVPEIQFRRRRQAEDPEAAAGPPGLTSGDLGPDLGPDVTDDLAEGSDSLVSIGEECEEWPVQKCTLQEKVVKKTTPNTACEKIPKEICAPSNCVVGVSPKKCRTETKALLQNIPTEECDLEPQENCKMETVLVPRLVQQPNCIKVPKEVCVNERVNPKKVSRPVVKEWCYKPSDLKEPTSRLALSQFFKKTQ